MDSKNLERLLLYRVLDWVGRRLGRSVYPTHVTPCHTRTLASDAVLYTQATVVLGPGSKNADGVTHTAWRNQAPVKHVCVAYTSHDHTYYEQGTQGHQAPAVQDMDAPNSGHRHNLQVVLNAQMSLFWRPGYCVVTGEATLHVESLSACAQRCRMDKAHSGPCLTDLVVDDFIWHCGLHIASRFCCQVHGHRPWLHALYHVACDQYRSLLARNECCCDDDVHILSLLPEQGHLHSASISVSATTTMAAQLHCLPVIKIAQGSEDSSHLLLTAMSDGLQCSRQCQCDINVI